MTTIMVAIATPPVGSLTVGLGVGPDEYLTSPWNNHLTRGFALQFDIGDEKRPDNLRWTMVSMGHQLDVQLKQIDHRLAPSNTTAFRRSLLPLIP